MVSENQGWEKNYTVEVWACDNECVALNYKRILYFKVIIVYDKK